MNMTPAQFELIPQDEGGFRLITETQEDGSRIAQERAEQAKRDEDNANRQGVMEL